MNYYVIKLPKGKYRLTVDAVGPGKVPVTCLSSITFDFVLDDEWYQRSRSIMESVYKKGQ
jgi:hypothetical protein